MRVAITGSNGLLGTKLLELLLAEPEVEPLAISRGRCSHGRAGEFRYWQADLCVPGSALDAIGAGRPDVVVHTAAMTDVDGCERAPERAWRENVEATRYVAEAARRVGARLVHLSTEYVFDGASGPYGEGDPTGPLSVYGRTKLASEQVARALLPGCVVARTTVLFGYAPHVRANFVTSLVARLGAGQTVRVVTDQVGSPTLADNLAQMVWALASDPAAAGVFNTVGATVLDRFDFAQLVARAFGLDASLVEPTDTAALDQLAPRPLKAGLRMEKFRTRYPGVPVLAVDEALARLRAQMEPLTVEAERPAAGRRNRAAGPDVAEDERVRRAASDAARRPASSARGGFRQEWPAGMPSERERHACRTDAIPRHEGGRPSGPAPTD